MKTILNILLVIFFFVMMAVAFTACEKPNPVLNEYDAPVYIPVKPFTIIDKIADSKDTNYIIVYVDANGKRLTFDVEFYNEDNYNVGDIIK